MIKKLSKHKLYPINANQKITKAMIIRILNNNKNKIK